MRIILIVVEIEESSCSARSSFLCATLHVILWTIIVTEDIPMIKWIDTPPLLLSAALILTEACLIMTILLVYFLLGATAHQNIPTTALHPLMPSTTTRRVL
jgi:hypothetical protein